ncbi:hypothetical protein KVV02_001941 [Mortierella alpina]|uniref:AB hydrolase-1 domain-containing protein n=1 Tax=Mortierella alpina TaxID=64518 RepID=A0A9P7ZYY4_MORAP|nr:hypothetical protein KVV02_001941 [Mortierella alpina]
MIVDHLVTRSAVRSVGLVLAAVVPLATGYFVYMLVYKETPLDTFLAQIPVVLQLLQSNSTAASIPAHAFLNTPSPSTAIAPTPVNSVAAPSTPFALSSASASIHNSHIPHLADSHQHSSLSPAMSSLLALAAFLESRGYRDPVNIPGYQYLIAPLAPLRYRLEPLVEPVFAFVASHKTLAWIVSLFHMWMAAEVLFYLHFWTRLGQAQEVDRVAKGPRNNQERRELFQRCIETIAKGDGAKKWVETWFDTGRTEAPAKFEQVGRSNMMIWLAWAFWAAPIEEVFESAADMMELNRMVDAIENSKGVKFAQGFNPEVDCIRLAFDPVVASHRPLIYYILLWAANALAGIVFVVLGFTRYEGTVDQTHTFEQGRKHKAPVNQLSVDPSTDLAYWYRSPINPDNKVPLVFIHGIGVGLVQYIHWVVALTTISRPIIMIEVPYVSNNLLKRDCMTPDETYLAIERILKIHDYPKATFMGHSLGTMLCAAVCRASPASSSKSIVAGLILADPICFMTHHSIARNFAYRTPATAAELIMDLFAAREIGTSWYIMRRFCWDQCIVFPTAWKKRHESPKPFQGRLSPVLPKRTRVFLSRNDNLLDMDLIAEYLRTHVGLKEEKEELHVMEDMDHAQFLLRPSWFFKVLKAAQEC